MGQGRIYNQIVAQSGFQVVSDKYNEERGWVDLQRITHFFFLPFTTGNLSAVTTAYGRREREDFNITQQRNYDGCRRTHLVKHVLQTLLRQSRTFNVLDCSEFTCKFLTLLNRDRALILLRQSFYYLRVIPKINLCSNQKERNPWTEMMQFWEPPFLHVFKGGRMNYAKADQEDICLRIGEGTKAIVFILTLGRRMHQQNSKTQ